jgi:hypothetical protein
VAAGLTPERLGFSLTPKVMRATGGTLLLELGVPDQVVMSIGGWANLNTLKRHYSKVRDESRVGAGKRMGEAAAAELGLGVADDAPLDIRLRAMQKRAERAEADVERLSALVVELGGEPAAPAPKRISSGNPHGVWTEDRVRAAIAGATTRREILTRLGISAASKHYQHLGRMAAELGLKIPGRWGVGGAA